WRGEEIFYERISLWTDLTSLAPLEEKVERWTREHPVIWNVGIGPTASFVQTLIRLLFERTKDLYYGPYDHIICVGPQPQRQLTSSILSLPYEELKQLAEEESYYGYGTISHSLMLKVFGWWFTKYFEPFKEPGLDYGREENSSQLRDMTIKAQGKRFLLLLENLHFPLSPIILAFLMWKRPSLAQNRWLISTTSKDVYNSTRQLRELGFQLKIDLCKPSPELYYSLPFDDLLEPDWAVLTKEALRDATRSIYNALQQQRDKEFWLHAAQHCLYYSILYHDPLEGAAKHEESTTTTISSDELVRCWVAEGLLSSIISPFDIPSGTDKKQSNHYCRSAYESPAVSSSQDVVTGLSKLAKDVPRLKKVQLSDDVKSNRLRWVSFMNDDGRHISWNWRKERSAEFVLGERTISTLILRGCSDISGFPLDKVLNHRLRVLDLSYTMIDTLPPWLSLVLNLLLLSLRGCSMLNKLSAPPLDSSDGDKTPALAHLGNLQVLDMNGVPLLELTQQDGSNKSNLHYLDLSGSRVITLPSEFFSEMSSLQELIFGNCLNLKELPPSLAKLTNLLILHIFKELQRLHTLKIINNKLFLSLPVSLSKASGLKELHIYNCISLRLQFLLELLPQYLEDIYIKAWEGFNDIEIHGHPHLATFSLSRPWIRYLSLRGCRNFKTLNLSDDVMALEAVDLSGTAIEEVPHNLPNQPQLRMLILLNVPCFKRFPWHQLVRFPNVFCLDHTADDNNHFLKMFTQQKICADEKCHREKTTNTAQVKINDSRIFHSFTVDAARNLVMHGQFLQSFNVHIGVRGKEPWNKEVELCTNIKKLSPYHDVHFSEAASIVSMMKLRPRQRHVEISAMNRYPHGLRQLLSVAQSIIIIDDAFVKCFNDLNYDFISLEACKLQHCHQMIVILRITSGSSEDVVGSLEILQACNLENLIRFVERPSDLPYYGFVTLKILKHIHIENCPRLEEVFPCNLSLPALESLVAPSPLPNIQRIYLQELPQLRHIHDDVMFSFETPKWANLFVRGCQSFQRLPLLRKEFLKSKVKVSGERDWLDKLQWSLPEQSNYYLLVPPLEFASRKTDGAD
ncbi:hypothetical protein EJB05_29098, partial [Eragrostis curvula]